MEFGSRFVLVLPAAFFAIVLIASVLVAVVWQFGAGRVARLRPGRRAAVLVGLRLAPVMAGLGATVALAAPAFHFYEPRGFEQVSALIVVLAGGGVVILAGTLGRISWSLLLTARARRIWRVTGRPIVFDGSPVPARVVDTQYPIVALIGLARPSIIVAKHVAQECPPDTLRAMLDHERAHLRRRDNLWRLVMSTPWDPVAWMATGRCLARAWHVASEEAADDEAADRIALAEGLIWIARRGTAVWPPALPASAIDGGSNIEHRVRRLLADPAPSGVSGKTLLTWAGGMAVAALAVFVAAGDEIWWHTHALIEFAVTAAP